MTRTPRPFPWIATAVAASWLAALGFVLHARFADGALGFPLDDAWIHLTYARTLAEHGQFAYFPGDPLTAGSTAPLYTLLEAGLFRLVRDEKLLAIALGLAAHLGFLVTIGRWAQARLVDARWAALAVALAGLDGRVALLAVSGMETPLFLALVALAIERRVAGRALASGLALGAALWVRPDALVLAAVFAVDALLAPRRPLRDALRTFGAFAAMAATYAAHNSVLGGHWLPATFAAKTAFYAERTRLAFLTGDVRECFGTGAWIAIAPFALIAIAIEAVRLARGREGRSRLEAGWAVALPLAYFALLPYSHRFTRYLVPALPAFAVLGVVGLRAALGWAAGRRMPVPAAAGAVLALAAILHAWALAGSDAFYRYACTYHAQRHERTGQWLAGHTAADAVVATHDVGAIAYYSRRRIFDTVGLVSPEVIPWIGTPAYTDSLAAGFTRHRVTHLAAFDEWLPVDNVPPLFEANAEPEVMRVFAWQPGRTRLVPRAAIRAGETAAAAFERGDGAAGMAALREALQRDPGSARWWVMLGDALARSGRADLATQAWQRARTLFPDSPEIAARLAAGSARR